MLLLFAA